jgi:uncharacterized protein (TIGR02246 family)
MEGDMQTEEERIIDEVAAFAEVWNRGDAVAAASFFTEDAVRVGAFGDRQQGRAELAEGFRKLFSGPMAGARVSQGRGEVRMLSPTFAVWDGSLEIGAPGGRTFKGHVVQVMQKIGDRWLVREGHPKFFPPPNPA